MENRFVSLDKIDFDESANKPVEFNKDEYVITAAQRVVKEIW